MRRGKMATAGRWEPIGGRLTYIPPFVNERFDGPPYWSCTFSALLNGANVAWLGRKPATHTEVAALAGASGDPDTRHGSRFRHMVQAVKVRYQKDVGPDNVSSAEAERRLADGWALVAGVTYGELPPKFRHWSPGFKLGHRVTVFGFSSGRTRLLDPLANMDETYGGIWIPWSDFAQAWWSDEQLWFKEGAFVEDGAVVVKAGTGTMTAKPKPKAPGQPVTAPSAMRVLRRFEPPRHFRIAAETTVVAYAAGNPPVARKGVPFRHASGAVFDALVTFDPKVLAPGDPGQTFLRITKGLFARRYIEIGARGITASIEPDQELPTQDAGAPVAGAVDLATAVLEARRAEWDRIAQATAGLVVLPPRP